MAGGKGDSEKAPPDPQQDGREAKASRPRDYDGGKRVVEAITKALNSPGWY